MGLFSVDLPPSLRVERHGGVDVLTLSRTEKRNALDDQTVQGIGRYFTSLSTDVRVVILAAEGAHYCAGVDLNELATRDAVAGVAHSQMWHDAFAKIENATVPVVAVLKGAVIGGGLELAAATHIRVSEDSAFFALPEGQRGLFVGGGGAVRLPRLIGMQKVRDMMLTGRVLSSTEALQVGLTDYLVPRDRGLPKALELAESIAEASPVSTQAILHALPRIAEADPATGMLMESLMAGVSQSSHEAKARMADFLAGRATKVSAEPATDAARSTPS